MREERKIFRKFVSWIIFAKHFKIKWLCIKCMRKAEGKYNKAGHMASLLYSSIEIVAKNIWNKFIKQKIM